MKFTYKKREEINKTKRNHPYYFQITRGERRINDEQQPRNKINQNATEQQVKDLSIIIKIISHSYW